MKTVARFDNRVENYVKYRPHYPPEMLDFFKTELGLGQSSVVADIGSGTGISSQPFAANGNPVCGIEPNRLMREASIEQLRNFPNFRALEGTSENTGLPDSSVDFIVAAQAFHWFRTPETLREFRRILRPNGWVALVWNERQIDSNEFLREYEEFLKKFGTDYAQVRHDNLSLENLEDFFQTKIYLKTFKNSQTFDFEGLLGRLLSSSYMPAADDELFPEMKKTLKRLFADHSEKGKIQVLYDTNIFYTKL